MRVRFFSLLAGLSLCGCAGMQDYRYNWTQCYRADAAWRESYGLWNTQFTCDYRDGWKQGHADIAKGNCHEPPPVPPKKYWGASYQSPEGRCCIDEWYNGWSAGAAASAACGNGDWHNITAAPTVPHGANSSTGFSTTATPAPAEIPAMAKREIERAAPAGYVQPPVHVAPLPQYGDNEREASASLDDNAAVGSGLSDNYAVPLDNSVPLDTTSPEPVSYQLGDDASAESANESTAGN